MTSKSPRKTSRDRSSSPHNLQATYRPSPRSSHNQDLQVAPKTSQTTLQRHQTQIYRGAAPKVSFPPLRKKSTWRRPDWPSTKPNSFTKTNTTSIACHKSKSRSTIWTSQFCQFFCRLLTLTYSTTVSTVIYCQRAATTRWSNTSAPANNVNPFWMCSLQTSKHWKSKCWPTSKYSSGTRHSGALKQCKDWRIGMGQAGEPQRLTRTEWSKAISK